MPPDKRAKWSADEDDLLRQGVKLHGDKDRWQEVADVVVTRDNKSCRKRWLHSLDPKVKKSAWTGSEDEKLVAMYAQHPEKWAVIARAIPGRTDDACSKRYREALDPTKKRGEWTAEEDELLLRQYATLGAQWKLIDEQLGRGSLACRNRWHLLDRKKPKPPPAVSPTVSQEYSVSPQSMDTAPPSNHPSPLAWGDATCAVDGSSDLMSVAFNGIAWDSEWSTLRTYDHDNGRLCHYNVEGTSPLTYAVETASSAPPHPPKPNEISSFSCLTNALSNQDASRTCPSTQDVVHETPSGSTAHFGTMQVDPQPAYSGSTPSEVADSFIEDDTPTSTGVSTEPEFACARESMDISADQSYNVFRVSDYSSDTITPSSVEVEAPENTWSETNTPPWELAWADMYGHIGGPQDFSTFEMDSYTEFLALQDINQTFAGPSHQPSDTPWVLSPTFSSFPSLNAAFYDQGSSSVCTSASPSPMDLPHALPSTRPLAQVASTSTSTSPPTKGHTLLHSPTLSESLLLNLDSSRPPRAKIPGTLTVNFDEDEDESAVRPYACGYTRCWTNACSTTRFTKVKDLLQHYRQDHENGDEEDEQEGFKPFRCGLPRCDKAWKSANGLQYHLEVSSEHFRDAVEETTPSSSSPSKFQCLHPGCSKSYRSTRGLKYHLKHGHPKKLPVQVVENCHWPRRARKPTAASAAGTPQDWSPASSAPSTLL